MAAIDPQDGGYASRKLVLVSASILLVAAVACLSTLIPSVQPIYSTFCGTVTALVATYCGASTLRDHISSRSTDDKDDTQK